MNKVGFLFLGAVISAGSVLFVGCGGESNGAGGAGGGSEASSTSGSGTPASSTSGSGTGSSSSTGAGAAATPEAYCKDVTANCAGDNLQYADEATCLKVAASFPKGDIGAMAGDSLECRAYHAGAAKSTMKPEVHCAHSGLTGGDLDPSATGAMADGPCGDGVEAFCKLAVDTCKGQTGAYADIAACTAEAKQFPKSTTPFSATKDVKGNTFNCRAYHLTAAVKDPATHCAHIKLDSAPCK